MLKIKFEVENCFNQVYLSQYTLTLKYNEEMVWLGKKSIFSLNYWIGFSFNRHLETKITFPIQPCHANNFEY